MKSQRQDLRGKRSGGLRQARAIGALLPVMLFCIISAEACSAPKEFREARLLVEAYIRDAGEDLQKPLDASKYFHPDIAFLYGETLRLVLVERQYTVDRIETVRENRNIINPKSEDLIAVTVTFQKVATVLDDKLTVDKGPYQRTFYLSKEEAHGQYLILDMTDARQRISFVGPFGDWVQKGAAKNTLLSRLLKQLESLPKEN